MQKGRSKAKSRMRTLDFRRADFGQFQDLLSQAKCLTATELSYGPHVARRPQAGTYQYNALWKLCKYVWYLQLNTLILIHYVPYQRYWSCQCQGQHWGGSGWYLSLSLNTWGEQAVQWRERTRVAVCLLLQVHRVLVPQPNCPSTSGVAQHTATLRKAAAKQQQQELCLLHSGPGFLHLKEALSFIIPVHPCSKTKVP